ncbi:MAG: hypothetical protein RQ862_04805 [Candidatus Caldarchaeales archaeon]|nr:hypothetical protein [Candidatus Caldarchaeales archaeon]
METKIIVGKKPPLRYVTACLTSFNRGSDKVILRGRGQRISTCVDVVNMLKRGFLGEVKIEKIHIGTELITIDDKQRPISFIEIVLSR